MKKLYRAFAHMFVASVALIGSFQASAAPAAVMQGTPAEIHAQNAYGYGYVEVDNDSKYQIYVRVPSVTRDTYAINPGRGLAYFVGNRLGANVYVAYAFNPYNETMSYVLNGETAEVWDPLYMASAKAGMMKASDNSNVKVNIIKHKSV